MVQKGFVGQMRGVFLASRILVWADKKEFVMRRTRMIPIAVMVFSDVLAMGLACDSGGDEVRAGSDSLGIGSETVQGSDTGGGGGSFCNHGANCQGNAWCIDGLCRPPSSLWNEKALPTKLEIRNLMTHVDFPEGESPAGYTDGPTVIWGSAESLTIDITGTLPELPFGVGPLVEIPAFDCESVAEDAKLHMVGTGTLTGFRIHADPLFSCNEDLWGPSSCKEWKCEWTQPGSDVTVKCWITLAPFKPGDLEPHFGYSNGLIAPVQGQVFLLGVSCRQNEETHPYIFFYLRESAECRDGGSWQVPTEVNLNRGLKLSREFDCPCGPAKTECENETGVDGQKNLYPAEASFQMTLTAPNDYWPIRGWAIVFGSSGK